MAEYKWDVSPSPGKKELLFTSFELVDHLGHLEWTSELVKSPVQILGSCWICRGTHGWPQPPKREKVKGRVAR